jgi:prevent-host-death family protein
MKIAPLAQVKDQFSAYIVESQKSPVIITKNGKPVALLTGLGEEDDLDTIVLARNPRLVQLLEEARESVRRTGGIPSKEFWAQARKRRARKRTP